MNAFCPLIKETCKEKECVSWKDEKCLFFSYLESRISDLDAYSRPEFDDFDDEKPKQVPSDIKSTTPEKLAEELFAFAKTEFSIEADERVWIGNISEHFWKSKKLDKWDLPPDMELKIEKVERIAQQLIDAERQALLEKRLEKEDVELPALVAECVTWAKQHGLKKVTVADVDSFVMKKKLNIHYQTKRNLYATVNLELKTAKS